MSWPASNSDTGEKNHFPSCRGEKGRKRSTEEEQLQMLRHCQKLRTVWSEKASSQNLSGAKWTSDRSDLKKKGKRQRRAHFQMSRRGHASASHGSRRSSRCMCDPPGPLQLRCGSEVQERGAGGRKKRVRTAGDQIRLLTGQSVHSGRREKPEGSFEKVFPTDALVRPLKSLPFWKLCWERSSQAAAVTEEQDVHNGPRGSSLWIQAKREIETGASPVSEPAANTHLYFIGGKKENTFFFYVLFFVFFSSQPA